MTARTAATREGGQSNDATAAGAATSAARSAARTILLTPFMLVLALAGCGGGDTGFRDTSRLENGVRAQLEQRLMRASPREGSARSATHIASVDCLRQGGTRYRCVVRFGDGTRRDFVVLVSRDGKSFRFA